MPRRVRLPALVQTLWVLFGMDSFARHAYERYPDEKMLTFRVVGFGDVVTVLDPDLIREMLTGDGEVLRAGEANAQALGFLGPNSVVLLDGEPHLRARRLLLPPFHGEAIAHHRGVVERVAISEIERWPVGAPLELGGYRLSAGTFLTAAIAGMQRSTKVYTDPWRFDPERFLNARPAPYTLIPFGGGTRRCIGASFAMMEIKAVLRTVLQHIDLRPAGPRPERPSRTRSIAIVPARGGRVIAMGTLR